MKPYEGGIGVSRVGWVSTGYGVGHSPKISRCVITVKRRMRFSEGNRLLSRGSKGTCEEGKIVVTGQVSYC